MEGTNETYRRHPQDDHVWLIPCGVGAQPLLPLRSIPKGDRVILVDDGANIGEKLEDRPGVRIARTGLRDGGCAHALNVGFRAMTGDWEASWVFRMDADDLSVTDGAKDRVEQCMKAEDDVAVIAGEMVGRGGRHYAMKLRDHFEVRDRITLRRNPIYHPATCIRTSFLSRVEGWPEEFGEAEDYALWCRIMKNEGKLVPWPKVWTYYQARWEEEKRVTSPEEEALKSLRRKECLDRAAEALGF